MFASSSCCFRLKVYTLVRSSAFNIHLTADDKRKGLNAPSDVELQLSGNFVKERHAVGECVMAMRKCG